MQTPHQHQPRLRYPRDDWLAAGQPVTLTHQSVSKSRAVDRTIKPNEKSHDLSLNFLITSLNGGVERARLRQRTAVSLREAIDPMSESAAMRSCHGPGQGPGPGPIQKLGAASGPTCGLRPKHHSIASRASGPVPYILSREGRKFHRGKVPQKARL